MAPHQTHQSMQNGQRARKIPLAVGDIHTESFISNISTHSVPCITVSSNQYHWIDEKGRKIRPQFRDAYEWWTIHQWYNAGGYTQEYTEERIS